MAYGVKEQISLLRLRNDNEKNKATLLPMGAATPYAVPRSHDLRLRMCAHRVRSLNTKEL